MFYYLQGSNLLLNESFFREGNRTVMCTCTAQNIVKGQARTDEKQVYFVVGMLYFCDTNMSTNYMNNIVI